MAWIAARRRALHYARAGKMPAYQRSAKGGRWKTKRRRLEARAAWEVLGLKTLDGFCCRRSDISGRGLRKRAAAGLLLGALVDLDGAFEIGAVFDHDARGGQVAFDRAVDLQVFVARNFAFHVQAGSEPRGCTVRSRTQWTQSICTHRGFSLPSRRSGLRRLIRL